MYANHTANIKHDEINSFFCSENLLFKSHIVALYFKVIALYLKDAVACNRKHKYSGQIPLSDS